MITKLQLDPGAIAPHRAHETDVGYDIHALHVEVAYKLTPDCIAKKH